MESTLTGNDMKRAIEDLSLALLPMEVLAYGDAFDGERLCMSPVFAYLAFLRTVGAVVHHIEDAVFIDIGHRMDTFFSREEDLLSIHYPNLDEWLAQLTLTKDVAKESSIHLVEILLAHQRHNAAELERSRTDEATVGTFGTVLPRTVLTAVDDEPIGMVTFGPCDDVLIVRIVDIWHFLGHTCLQLRFLAP